MDELVALANAYSFPLLNRLALYKIMRDTFSSNVRVFGAKSGSVRWKLL